MNRDELLKEAKERFPTGTKFIGIYTKTIAGLEQTCIVTESYYSVGSDGDILCPCDRPEEGARGSGTYIRYRGVWADVVPGESTIYSIF